MNMGGENTSNLDGFLKDKHSKNITEQSIKIPKEKVGFKKILIGGKK